MISSNTSKDRKTVVSGNAVGKDYGEKVVLKRLDFEVYEGEVVAFTGPNGCGKTTLLKMVGTLLPSSRGSISIFNEKLPTSDINLLRRKIGAVYSDLFLYEDLTIEENLELYSVLYDVDDRKNQICSWVERLGIEHVFHERVRHLSRGQQQRATIARSLLHDPEIIIWDEPLTALDQEGRELMREIINERRGRCTFLIATHDENLAQNWIDRRLVIKNGLLEA